MKYLFLSVSLLLLSTNVLFAQVSEFPIRVLVGSDTAPPTTPVLLTANPVAQTQIDLSWSLSTDNILVAGYAILRDSTPIATTTLLSYSDTGLSASTTYAYTVRAFDSSLNYSSSSNSLATTTFDVPPPPSPTPTTTDGIIEGTIARIVVDEFYVNEGVSTSSIHLNTAQAARVEVRWGRTVSYELGYVVSDVYRREHAILLTDLEPGTTYEYQVIGYTPHGTQSVISAGSFTTMSESVPVTPTNVSRFQAVQNENDVDLSWQVPTDDSISHVRIVRSYLGFPEHPQDGAIVYQGLRGGFRDVGILSQYSPVYYTAFVYDKEGNISSGAVAMVYARQFDSVDSTFSDETTLDTGAPILNPPAVIDEATTTINRDRVTVEMKMPQPSDIAIVQESRHYSLLDTNISLDSEQVFLISIPRVAVAGNLKSIIVTVLDPTDNKNSYSYLLRINRDQTAYSAMVPALQVEGRSQIKIEIYDFEAFVVATYQTPLVFTSLLTNKTEEVVFPDAAYNNYMLWLGAAVTIVLMFILIFLVYRKLGEDNG